MIMYTIKKMISILVIGMLLGPLQAQINRTIDTKVADLLVQMPAQSPAHRNKLMSEMLEMGEEVRLKIAQQITEPGTGDDTNARFAIESYSKFVSDNKHSKAKVNWELLLLKMIKQGSSAEVKAFFIRQLEFVGSDQCLPFLSEYLKDERLISPAVKSMLLSDYKKATPLLVDALEGTPVPMQIELVKGIAGAEDAQYAGAVAALRTTNDTQLKATVLRALAAMPGEIAEEILYAEAKKVRYNPDATGAVFALLQYCETIALEDAVKAEKIADIINKKSTAVQVRINAMLIKSRVADSAGREKVLLSALKDKDKTYRGAAIEEAVRNQLPVEPWIKALQRSKSPDVQMEVLYFLSQAKDKSVADAIVPFISSEYKQVRACAALTYAVQAKEKGLAVLLNYLAKQSEKEDVEAAQKSLLLVLGKANLGETLDSYERMPAHAQIVLLNVWGIKKQQQAFDKVLKATASRGDLRSAAFNNLDKVSGEKHLDDLLKLYDKLDKESELEVTAKAIVKAVKSADNTAVAEKKVNKAAREGETLRYIPVYSAIGGKDAVSAVVAYYKRTQSPVALNALATWGDHNASEALYNLCKAGNMPGNDRRTAFKGYVNMVASSELPHDQQLLLLRKGMEVADNNDEKALIIQALANVKTFLSFVYVSTYLDDKNLQSDAANSLAKIAMPDAGKKNGLTGQLIAEGLEKSRALISGQDSQYLKIDIENYLNSLAGEKGYVSMFNGKNLDGWQGFVDNPIRKKKLSPYNLKKRQEEANKKMTECWSVKDGMIVFNGKGHNMCSVKEYGDFEMLVDWRITKEGDSGIYLRGSPQIQIWDTTLVKVGAQVGSGGLYNNQKHESKPLLVADNPVGDWNTFYIKMIGERVTVYLNGLLVVDNVVMENYWDRSLPIFAKGPIELQAHGTDLAFRDVYVNELNSNELNLTEEEKKDGFKALFNGVDLSGWTGNKTDYKVINGEIVVKPENGGHGNLFTEKEYADFNYRFEFKLTPGANNGIGIRAPLEGDAAYEGMELQVLDNTAAVYANLEPYQYHGSVYGVISAKRGFLKPVGEWNSEEVIVKGKRVKVILNGEVIVDGDIAEASEMGTLDGKEHPGLKRTKGHIGFLGHGSVVYFRNIRIKEL